jgi:outer membrane protein assembly factor BamD (BamD/ComL family)
MKNKKSGPLLPLIASVLLSLVLISMSCSQDDAQKLRSENKDLRNRLAALEQEKQDTAESHYQKGTALLTENNLAAAKKEFEIVADRFPNSPLVTDANVKIININSAIEKNNNKKAEHIGQEDNPESSEGDLSVACTNGQNYVRQYCNQSHNNACDPFSPNHDTNWGSCSAGAWDALVVLSQECMSRLHAKGSINSRCNEIYKRCLDRIDEKKAKAAGEITDMRKYQDCYKMSCEAHNERCKD